jgi:hypothetical protein
VKFLAMLLFCIFPLFPHTDEDVQILGDMMWAENGHTGLNEQDNRDCIMLTGAVITNRMADGGWCGKTVKEVVFASGQYASDTKAQIGKTDTPQWVYDMAEDLLNYGCTCPEYVCYQSMQPNLGTVWKVIENGRKDEYFATNGGHKHEGDDFHPEINSHYGRDLRIFDYVFGSADRAGTISAALGHIRWCGYFRSLFSLAMANLQGGGLLYP